jgi:hypothetical protein
VSKRQKNREKRKKSERAAHKWKINANEAKKAKMVLF